MLKTEHEYNVFKKMLDKIEDKNLINDYLLKIYKNKLNIKNESQQLNFNNFIYVKICSLNHLKKVSSMLNTFNIRMIINNNNFDENLLVDFLLSKSKEDNFKDLFMFLKIHLKEENLIKLKDYYSLSNILEKQKNVNFVFKEIKRNLTNDELTSIFRNENLEKDFIEKFMEKYTNQDKTTKDYKFNSEINQINEEQIKIFFENIYIDEDFIKKYAKILVEYDIKLENNKKLTEKIIEKYIDDRQYNKLKYSVDVSKTFIKNNVDKFTFGFVFTKITNIEDIKYFLDLLYTEQCKLIRKGNKINERTILYRLLSTINLVNNKIDFDFYEEMFEKYKFNYSIKEKIKFFNKNTSPKHFSILEKEFKEVKNPEEIKFYSSNYDYDIFKHLIVNTNIPDDFIIKYFPYLTYNVKESNLFELIEKQIIPDKLRNKDFYKKLNLSSIFIYLEQIKNTKELKDMSSQLDMLKIKTGEFILMKNINYLKNLKHKDLNNQIENISMYTKNSDIELNRGLINLSVCLSYNNELITKNEQIKQQDFGLSY